MVMAQVQVREQQCDISQGLGSVLMRCPIFHWPNQVTRPSRHQGVGECALPHQQEELQSCTTRSMETREDSGAITQPRTGRLVGPLTPSPKSHGSFSSSSDTLETPIMSQSSIKLYNFKKPLIYFHSEIS